MSLAGKRVAAYRAGIIAIIFIQSILPVNLGKSNVFLFIFRKDNVTERKRRLRTRRSEERRSDEVLACQPAKHYQNQDRMQTSDLLNNYYVDPGTWDEMYTDRSVRQQYQGVV